MGVETHLCKISCLCDIKGLRYSLSKFATLNGLYSATIWPIAVILGSVTILKVPDVCANFQNFLPDGKGATMRSVRRIIRIIIRRILTITIGIHASL